MFGWGRDKSAVDSSSRRQSAGSVSSAASPPLPSAMSRREHVDQFLSHPTFRQGTKFLGNTDQEATYETSFCAYAGSKPYTLSIVLDYRFPVSPPQITLIEPPLATHEVINENMMALAGSSKLQALNQWTSLYSTYSSSCAAQLSSSSAVSSVPPPLLPPGVTLLSVVEQVVLSLIAVSPRIVGSDDGRSNDAGQTQRGTRGAAAAAYSNSAALQPPSYKALQSKQQLPSGVGRRDGDKSGGDKSGDDGGGEGGEGGGGGLDFALPSVPTSFEDLADKSRDVLLGFLSDDVRRQEYVDNLPQVKFVKELDGQKVSANVAAARQNLQREEEMSNLHADVQSLSEQLEQAVAHFKDKASSLQRRADKEAVPVDKALLLLQSAAGEDERLGEARVLAFQTNGGGSANGVFEAFLESYLEVREKYHKRMAGIERIKLQGSGGAAAGAGRK